MTKPIVSVAAMMLVEQGHLLLSDPVSKFMPELQRLKVGVDGLDAKGQPVLGLAAARQPITVQDLLMQAPEQRNHYRQLFRNLVYAALE
ncbi:MAG: serine hydrolase [Noviherbaspirillum sp.]